MRFTKAVPMFVLLSVLALSACTSFKVFDVNIEYDHGFATMENGLRVLVVPNPDMAKTLVTVRYNVGGAHAVDGKEGLPHLVEHLAFRVGDRFVEKKPSTTGGRAPTAVSETSTTPTMDDSPPVTVRYLKSDNAWTNMDTTFYWEKTAPAHLDAVLQGFSRVMGDFSSTISQEVLDVEREVVRNERRSSYEANPLDGVWLDIYDKVYAPGHPYHGSNIGSHESIGSITLADISEFLQKHYHPANAILTVMGPVQVQSTWALVQKHFGTKKKRHASTLSVPSFNPQKRERIIEVPGAETTRVTVMWPLGKGQTEVVQQLKLVDRTTGGWFPWKLVSQKDIADWSGSWVLNGEHDAMYVVMAEVKEHDDAQRAKNLIIDVADSLGRWVDKTWLNRQKRRTMYGALYPLENQVNLAKALSWNIHHYGQPMAWTTHFDKLKAMDFKAARASTWELLDEKNATVMIHTPRPDLAGIVKEPSAQTEEEQAAPGQSASENEHNAGGDKGEEHAERESPRKVYDFVLPYSEHYAWASRSANFHEGVEAYTLDNGMQVLVKQYSKSLRVMAVSVGVYGGEADEPQNLSGVAGYALTKMRQAARDDREFVSRMTRHSYTSRGPRHMLYTWKFPSMYAHDGLRIMADRLENPRYSWRSISESIESRIDSLPDVLESIDSLGWRALMRLTQVDTISRFATEATLADISLWDIKSFHEGHFYPENMVLSVVGRRPVAEMKLAIQESFGQWNATGKAPRSVEGIGKEIPPLPNGNIISVPTESSQSKIMLAFNGPGASHWERKQLHYGMRVLLRQKLRDLRSVMGVTYGVHVNNYRWHYPGYLVISSKVERGATSDAVDSLLELLDRFRDSPVSAGELEMVKRAVFQAYASSGKSAMAQSRAKKLTRSMLGETSLGEDAKVVDFWHDVTLAQFQAEVNLTMANAGSLIVIGAELEQVGSRAGRLARYTGELMTYQPESLIK